MGRSRCLPRRSAGDPVAKRQSEIVIPFTRSAKGDTAWAIVDHPIVLERVAVDEYYLVFDPKVPSLTIAKRDRGGR